MTSNTARPRNVGPHDPNAQVEDSGQQRRPDDAYKNEAKEAGQAAKAQPGGKVSQTKDMDVGTPPDHPGLGKQGSTSLPTE